MNVKLNHNKSLIIFIIGVALYLRLQNINCGLPYVLNPNSVPPFFLHLHLPVLFFTSYTFDVNNLVSALDANPQALYLPLRFVSLIFGIGSVIVVYFIGRIFNTLVGLLASGFLSVSFLHVKYSQMFLPFNAMVFFSLLSTFFAIKVFKDKNKSLVPSAIFASLSLSVNYLSVVSITPVLLVLALNKDFSKLRSLLIIFFGVFLLLNPYFIFYIFHLLTYFFKSYVSGYYSCHSSSYLLQGVNYLLTGVGPVIWISALCLIRFKNDYDLNTLKILFSLPFLYLGFLGLFHLTSPGYAILLAPYICIASALVFNSFYTETTKLQDFKTREALFTFIVLLLFAFYIPLKYTFKYNKIISLDDTRVLATEWIKENTSADYRVASDKNSIQTNWNDPDMLTTKQKFLISSKLLRKKSWFQILRTKVDYVVIDSLDYERTLRQPGHALKKKYYNKLLKLKPEITFNPYLLEYEKKIRRASLEDLYSPFETLWQRERAGPLIKIYKL